MWEAKEKKIGQSVLLMRPGPTGGPESSVWNYKYIVCNFPCLKNTLESGPINFSYAPRDPEVHFKKHRLKGP